MQHHRKWTFTKFPSLPLRLEIRAWFEWVDSESNPSDGLSRLGLECQWTQPQCWSLSEVVSPQAAHRQNLQKRMTAEQVGVCRKHWGWRLIVSDIFLPELSVTTCIRSTSSGTKCLGYCPSSLHLYSLQACAFHAEKPKLCLWLLST